MTMYQLRLPESLDLDQWLDEVSWAVWEQLSCHSLLEPMAPQVFVRIRELLHEVLEQHVTAYRSCGLWSYCQAGTTPSPWMPPEAFHPDEPRVRWYILKVDHGLDEVVAEATDRISELVFQVVGGSLPCGVFEPAVETALRRGIGRYLYENHHCGEQPFCDGALKVDPWNPKEMPPWCPNSSGSRATG